MVPCRATDVREEVSIDRPAVTIIRHRGESPQKCSLTPLRGAPGFAFHPYPAPGLDVSGHLRLAVDGPLLSAGDADRPLLLLDGSWRRAERMHRVYAHVTPRALPPLRTVYPRTSKTYPDPDGGLASIEALIAAFRILGWASDDVERAYPLSDAFRRTNAAFFTPG